MATTNHQLTETNIIKCLFLFAAPMIIGNLLQQFYNLTDTFLVGRYLGKEALAAVGGTYALTTFLYSVLTGFCMGCGALTAYYHGMQNQTKMKRCICLSFCMTGILALLIEAFMLFSSRTVLHLIQIPDEISGLTNQYLQIILIGFFFVFLFQFYTYIARAIGDSLTPLIFLALSTIINIVLDILFITRAGMHVEGAALATLIAQAFSGIGLFLCCMFRYKQFRPKKKDFSFSAQDIVEVLRQSGMSSVQQSVMNFGILMVQGLVNSFGTVIMAAFTIAVKIDTLAYMPAQEFGNAYSLFISQNLGAEKYSRIKKGTSYALRISSAFCVAVSAVIFFFAEDLMKLFITDSDSIAFIGAHYLRIEGSCYIGIGILFLLYGYFRGINRPSVSLFLTILSLGTRVLLAYLLSAIPAVGVTGIWISIPIGWALADTAGFLFMKKISIHT